ncbi:MAG: class I SAM-dependent methyltransferase [Pseudomonadota bacterium]
MDSHVDNAKAYDQICTWYEAVTKDSEYGVAYVVKAIGKDTDRSRALDVGCGVGGAILTQLITSGYKVTALDFSPQMLSIAKRRYPHVHFIGSDFNDWVSDEKFNLVVAWDSLIHTPTAEQRAAITKLCHHLEESGVLIFTGGGVEGDISGEMNGVTFSYGSLSYTECVEIIERCHCEVLAMEKDQEGQHVVYICRKLANE